MIARDRLEITGRTKTTEGFLRVSAVFARSGVQQYTAAQVGLDDRPANDVVNVYRPAGEVFDQAAIDSFALTPVTNDHPDQPITSDNAREFTVGMSGETVERDGDLLRGTLTITDADAVRDIESGKVELSGGYDLDYVLEAGTTPDGEAYDAIQKNIRGNHIAIVDAGRCGHACRIDDSANQTLDDGCGCQGEPMKKSLTIDGIAYELDEQSAQLVTKLRTALDAAEEKAEEAEKDKDEAEKEKEEADEKAALFEKEKDEAEAEKDAALETATDAIAIDALVEERSGVILTARRLCDGFETKGKTNAEIRREVVGAKTATDVEDKSDDYVAARFDALAEGGRESESFVARNFKAKDGVVDNRGAGERARLAAMDKAANAYKGEAA